MLKLQNYINLPLSFEINQGQTVPEVAFLTRGSGYKMFFTPVETVLLMQQSIDKKPSPNMKVKAQPIEAKLLPKEQVEPPIVLRITLAGANQQPQIQGLEELPGKVNYFIGNDPSKWHTNISTFSKIKYHDVYPGIDIVYYGSQGHLEYDYVISPGTDPGLITLDIQGVNKLDVDENGDLVLETGKGQLHFKKPYIYQEVNGIKKEIPGGYLLKNLCQVNFQVGDYNNSLQLIIDPVLEYSTYLGGTGADNAMSIAVDSYGNAYVAGSTNSDDFPTEKPIQDTLTGYFNVFVSKINADASKLLYSTYLGGSGLDFAYGISVDSSGSAYVAGSTSSDDFPTNKPIQGTFAGGFTDAFVSKINADGSELIYSTYLGGGGGDIAHSISVDSSGNAYVAGETSSNNFPTNNPIQSASAGGISDAFVSKINADGSKLLYSTYLGGSGWDIAYSIAVDPLGNVYLAGNTASDNFPTRKPIQAANAGGPFDAFITKINADGSKLLYSTYLGGNKDDGASSIAVDSYGNALITGFTNSDNFPTQKPIQGALAGSGGNAFVTKINPDGSKLLYSTYLGGSGSIGDGANSIAVDSSGNAYVAGSTSSGNFPVKNPIQGTFAGGFTDAFVSRINADGSALLYSTYLGGSGTFGDEAISIAVDSSGNAYVTGFTDSGDFPVKAPIQSANAGGFDAFICKISLSQLDNIEAEVNDIEVKLDNPDFGLKSIKEGINSIKAILNPDTLTTGAVVRDKHANSLIIVLLNDTATIKTVTIYVYNIKTSPKTVIFEKTVNIKPNCTKLILCSRPPLVYEVRFTGIVPGTYAWTATRKEDICDPPYHSTLISANTFNHSQLAASIDS